MTRQHGPFRQKKANREKASESSARERAALFNTGASLPCGIHLAKPVWLFWSLERSLYKSFMCDLAIGHDRLEGHSSVSRSRRTNTQDIYWLISIKVIDRSTSLFILITSCHERSSACQGHACATSQFFFALAASLGAEIGSVVSTEDYCSMTSRRWRFRFGETEACSSKAKRCSYSRSCQSLAWRNGALASADEPCGRSALWLASLSTAPGFAASSQRLPSQ